MLKSNQTPRQAWIDRYDDYEFVDPGETILFQDLLDKYLPKGGSCFEIGCYPGKYLLGLGKRYNYTVSGIDFLPGWKGILQKRLSDHNVRVGSLIEGDFLEFASDTKFDVVCSFGFIEHFTDTEDVIVRHIRILKPGGILVFTCPNFKKGQYLLHKWLDRKNLAEHNIDSMDFQKWTDILLANNMDILHQNYYRTAGFWVEKADHEESRFQLARTFAATMLTYTMSTLSEIVNYPNSVLSPFMISISRKKEEGSAPVPRLPN